MSVLLLALVTRSLVGLSAKDDTSRFFTTDSSSYVALAHDLRSGYLNPQSSMFPDGLFRTPVYPGFLSIFLTPAWGSAALVVVVQIGLSVLTVWLTILLGNRLAGPRVALLAGLVLAVDPVSVLYACFVQPETLFTLFLVLGVLGWAAAIQGSEFRLSIGSGVLLGLAALTRPIGLFLPFWLAPAVLLTRDGRRRGGLVLGFLLGAAVPIGGWMTKNFMLTGTPTFTIVGDSSLLHYRAAGALARDEGISIDEARALVRTRLLAVTVPGSSVIEQSRKQRELAFEILWEHKLAAIGMMCDGGVRLLAGTGLTALSNLRGDLNPEAVSTPGKLAFQGLQAVVLLFAYGAVAWAVVMMFRGKRFFELFFSLGVVAYIIVLSAGPEANTRFRFPAAPFLAFLVGQGLSFRRAS